MRQKNIKSVNDALGQAESAIGGATQHGAAIGLQRHTAAAITTDKTSLLAKRDVENSAKTELASRRSVLRSLIATAIAWVFLVRDLLKGTLGRHHSAAWILVGFIRNLKIPRSLTDLAALVNSMAAYLAAHPELERVELNVTADRGFAIYDELIAAANAVKVQEGAVRAATAQKKAAFNTVRKRISGLTRELTDVLAPLDTRWLAFGLNMPGAFAIPGVPQEVTVTLLANNMLGVKWKGSPRADHYRIFAKINGVDEELKPVGSASDLDFALEGVPSATKVELAVSAVNNGGESQKSEIVTVTTS